MPIITVTAGTPAIPAGTYLAELIDVTPKRMVTQYSKNGEEQDFLEWTWLLHASDRDVEITSLTTTATTPKSRINEYLTALLGADKVVVNASFDTDTLIGKQVMVQTIVQESGFAKIDKIVAAPKVQRMPPVATAIPPAGIASRPVAANQVTLDQEIAEDDLPF